MQKVKHKEMMDAVNYTRAEWIDHPVNFIYPAHGRWVFANYGGMQGVFTKTQFETFVDECSSNFGQVVKSDIEIIDVVHAKRGQVFMGEYDHQHTHVVVNSVYCFDSALSSEADHEAIVCTIKNYNALVEDMAKSPVKAVTVAPTRIPFNLDRALAGDAVVDRQGMDLVDFKADTTTMSGYGFSARNEGVKLSFTSDGGYNFLYGEHPNDLFMKYESHHIEPKGYPLADGSMSSDYVVGDKFKDKFNNKPGDYKYELGVFENNLENWACLTPTKGTLRKVAKRKSFTAPNGMTKQLSGWVNVYSDGNTSHVHTIRSDADASSNIIANRILCIDLSQHNEGEGL